ncbi:MAG: type II toxin-antitoxin system RelE/ParE family toxin [Chloroflexota bacterium]
MEVLYRRTFLKDLNKLKNEPVYQEIHELAFTVLPEAKTLRDVPGVKAMKGYPKRYRIRLGQYRIGIEVEKRGKVEMMRVLHRHEFYRYFP